MCSPLGNAVAPMIAAPPPERKNPLDHGSSFDASHEGGVPGAPAPQTTKRDTDLSAMETPPFSIGMDDQSRPTPPGLMYHWHLNAVFVAHAELKTLSTNRLEVRRLQAVCGGSDSVFVRRFKGYMGARSCWVVLEGLHCDV